MPSSAGSTPPWCTSSAAPARSSPAVEASLAAAGYTVRRVAGTDRLRSATAVAETFAPGARSAILVRAFASGDDPTRALVDALAANSGTPILFSETANLSAATREYLEQHPISSVTLVGGTAALADKVQEDLTAIGVESERSPGLNRADTARMVNGGLEREETSDIVVVDGTTPDGWVDGFAAAGHESPILLSSGDALPAAAAQELGLSDASSRIVCGTTTTGTACGRSEVARELELDLPGLAAFIDDEERGGLAEAAGVNGLYFGDDGTTLCYDYFGTQLEITASHVHRQSDSAAVVPMTFEQAADSDPFGCTFGVAPAVLADIEANPADYYSNVHTAELPAGAISGTLTNLEVIGLAGLLGESEVPGPGDPDAIGFSFFVATDTPGELCAILFVDGLGSESTAAHIHEGSSTESGPVVLTLQAPSADDFPPACFDAGEPLLDRLRTDPSAFYVNIHSEGFPDGAIRGQLAAFG